MSDPKAYRVGSEYLSYEAVGESTAETVRPAVVGGFATSNQPTELLTAAGSSDMAAETLSASNS